MNHLRKKAYTDLIGTLFTFGLMMLAYLYLTVEDIHGTSFFLWSLPSGITAGIVAFYSSKRKTKKCPPLYDERELYLMHQADKYANCAFISYQLLSMFILFMLLGGQAKIAVWALPVLVFSGLLFAQCVYSLTLLRSTKDDQEYK